MDDIIVIIPARRNSKTINRKNLYPLVGKSLIQYTIDVVNEAGFEYVITTDDEAIIGRHPFAIERPKELAGDESNIVDEIKRLDNNIVFRRKYYMLLQPTSPIRHKEHLLESYRIIKESNASSLYSGYNLKLKTKDSVYNKHTSKNHFQRNGSIFITKRELILDGKMWDDDAIEYEMPLSMSVDIDNMDEMFIAESLIKNGILK